MSENFSGFACQDSQLTGGLHDKFKEAVCIDAYRVYDSCADRDCIEDLRVYFTESGQHVIEQACSVRIKDIKVVNMCLDLEPVTFQKGYYAVDMTFFFEICFEACVAPASSSVSVCGVSVFTKKVILYGSEGSVAVFNSDYSLNEGLTKSNLNKNLPRATVQIADPIGLSSVICDVNPSCCVCEPQCKIPSCICNKYGGDFVCSGMNKIVKVTIGMFSIVQLERNVQMLVPAYDFCIPDKECIKSSDNPCELFSRLDFPTDEFFPPKTCESSIQGEETGGCCCKH